MGEFTDGPLGLEITKIIRTPNNRTNTIDKFITLHTAELDIKIPMISSIETLRDYNSNLSDHIVITFFMMAGDYIKDVMPFKNNLEISIREYDKIKKESSTVRYKFIITSNDKDMYGGDYTRQTKENLNKAGQLTIVGQCLLREIEVGKTKNVDGMLRNITVKDAMLTEMINGFKSLKIEGKPIDIRCDIVEPNNTLLNLQIPIPTGTRMLDFPSYLQNTNYGVYNGSIGTYLQYYEDNPVLYIYPLYDKTLFDKVTKKLMIYYSNSSKLTYIENTYQIDGDLIKLVAGNDVTNTDSGDNDLMDAGDGIMSSNPSLINKRNAIVEEGKATASKENQMSANKVKDKKDGVSNQVYVGNEPNLYKHRSVMNMKTSTIFQIPWRYSNIDLLYPSMPVCFKYYDKSKGIVMLYGNVHSVYERYSEDTKTTSAILNVIVSKPSNEYE